MRRDYYRGRMMATVIALIGIMGLGYAFLHADLKINGVASIPSLSWNVRFKANSINVTTGSVPIDTTNNEQAARIDDDTNLSYKVRLGLPGDFYEFTVVVENTGNIDAMIDSISSKLGDTEITTGTLPSYLTYTVTYSDGIEIQPKQILAKNTEETLKVRLEFKKDVQASQLPSLATTLNLNFQINYVQADDTAVVKPIPTFTGIKYGVYPSANRLTLNSAVPANAILHSTPSDALADWTNPSVMNSTSKPFYLKHKIENDVVTESYVVFTVTDEMVQANPGMTAGTYELRGGINESSASEKTYHIQNAKTIYDAFGTNCSSNPYTTTPSSDFYCSVSGLEAAVNSIGSVYAEDDSSSSCYVGYNGLSYCN
ncbi:MAG: hypothetical protein IKE70_04100 [Bacilli bacterium]|nr:hypothetical protein [Bacilli bacterium]